jgi:dephospho-CoA kinase
MLRVGLTGGLGSGKSTAACLFAQHGAHILSADEIGREMMQPGQLVYAAIVQHFGTAIVLPDGQLDRTALARIAFTEGRVEDLNAIVHPAVIARQAEIADSIFARHPHAVVIVESALIFETAHGGDMQTAADEPASSWRTRFDCILLVTAPEQVKIERYLQRISAGSPLSPERRAMLIAEAHRRLARQIPDDRKAALSDFVLINDGPLAELERQINELWPVLEVASIQNHAAR